MPLEIVEASAYVAGRYDWDVWERSDLFILRVPCLAGLEAGLDLGTEVGCEALAWTVVGRVIEGVQKDGSGRDGARREDDIGAAAPQCEWAARGMQNACVRGVVTVFWLSFEAFNDHIRGNHEW